MKLKQIKLNGIRGFSYWKDENNNPNPHLINLDGKHLFLFGENGSGKSSFFDSLEWCITGSSPEGKNRRIETQEDFLKNAFNAEDDIPFVEVSFTTQSGDVYKREVRRGARQNPFAYEEEAEINFIESSRIEKFVINTPRNLWESFLLLLGLDDLIQFRNQQNYLRTEAEKELKRAEDFFTNSKGVVSSLKKEVEELEKNLKNTLGENWKSNLDDSKSAEAEKLYKQFVSLEKTALVLYDTYQSIATLKSERNKAVTSLEKEKEKIENPKVAGVINEAYTYFNTDEKIDTCPVCETHPIKQSDVLLRLQKLKEAYSNIISLETRIKELDGQIVSQNRETQRSKPSFIKEYLESYSVDWIEETDDELSKFLTTELKKITDKKEEYFSSIKNSNFQQEIGVYKAKLIQFSVAETSHEKTSEDYRLKKTIFEQIDTAFNSYKTEYGEKIKQELSAISKNKVTPIYNKINQSTNENIDEFDIETDIDKEQISFRVKFKGSDKWEDAIKVLSTGHLRCLGFALLITRLKEKKPTLKFIAIDDPIYSIDHEHRYNLTQYFQELAQEYQLVITTSDRNFYDIIRNAFAEPQIRAYKTFFSQENSTEIGKHYSNYIIEAEAHLELNDFRAASLYSRLALETKIVEMAKKIKLPMTIDRIDKIGVREIFDSNFKTKLKEKYPDRSEVIETELSKLQKHRYFQSLTKGFPLDEMVHFPGDERGFTYSSQEVSSVIDTVKNFIAFSQTL